MKKIDKSVPGQKIKVTGPKGTGQATWGGHIRDTKWWKGKIRAGKFSPMGGQRYKPAVADWLGWLFLRHIQADGWSLCYGIWDATLSSRSVECSTRRRDCRLVHTCFCLSGLEGQVLVGLGTASLLCFGSFNAGFCVVVELLEPVGLSLLIFKGTRFLAGTAFLTIFSQGDLR